MPSAMAKPPVDASADLQKSLQSLSEALAKGMEAKAVEFVKKGAEIYSKA